MQVSLQWLPVVDDLERAIEHVRSSEDCGPEVVEGVRVIRDRALSVLAQLGFPRFDATGERFDPARHEAVSVIDSDEPPGTVVATTRTGYGAGEVVLRPAGVVVARAPAPEVGGRGTRTRADGRPARLLRGPGGRPQRLAGRDPAQLPAVGPHLPPRRQQGP